MQARTTIPTLMLFIFLLPVAAVAAGLGELRLSMIEGDVQIKNVDTGDWAPATINLPLKDGDQLWVPDRGRAEVEARRGTIVRLDERSLLEILRVDNDALQFYLSMGLGYVNAKGERGDTLQLETPVASIRVFERAKFSTEVADDGNSDISVFLGEVAAENRTGMTRVEAGNLLSLGDNYADLSPLSLADAWERWNKDQDRAIEERRKSVRYLPDELAGYSRDFDDNGEWVDDPSYGYVWRPIVQISIGWSPYRHGRWLWIGGDYVWVASEPWGWAPYHYGRWSHIGRHGWCWVPPARHEVHWGPGYVGWVRTATHVSWVPLAPRETYYGRGDYGPHSVNIINVNINTIVHKEVYQNAYVPGAIPTLDTDTFKRPRGHKDPRDKKGRRQQDDIGGKDNPFLRNEISFGGPQIEPDADTKLPEIREIPKENRPPAQARKMKPGKAKEPRRLVKDKDKSAFQPDKAPEAMPVEVRQDPKPKAPRRSRAAGTESEKAAAPTAGGGGTPVPAEGAGTPAALPPEETKGSREPRVPPGAARGPGGARQEGRRGGTPPPQAEALPAPGGVEPPPDSSVVPPAGKRRPPRRTPPAVESGQPQTSPPGEREIVVPDGEPAAPAAEPRRRPRRMPPPGVDMGQPGQGGESDAGRQPVEPGTRRKFESPPPSEREVVPGGEPAAPAAEPRRRPRRTPPPAIELGQPGQGESDAARQPIEPGTRREFGTPPPSEREVVPGGEPSAPAAEPKRRRWQPAPPQGEKEQPAQGGGESGGRRQSVEPGARGVFRPPPVEREVAPVEQPPAPPASPPLRRFRQPAPPQVEGGLPPQESGGRRMERGWQDLQPPRQEVEIPPPKRRREREQQPQMPSAPPVPQPGVPPVQQVIPTPPPPPIVVPPPAAPQGGAAPAPPPADEKKKGKKKKRPGQEEDPAEPEVPQ